MSNQMSLIEVALKIMEQQTNPIDIYELFEKVFEEKDIVDSDGTYAAKLYVEIVKSSKFVIFKDKNDNKDKIDLKSRQSLDIFDQDGSSFNDKEDRPRSRRKAIVDDEDLLLDNEDEEDSDEEYDDDNYEEDNYEEEDSDEEYEDEDDNYEDDNYDDEEYDDEEDKYNKYMDDYEGMYED